MKEEDTAENAENNIDEDEQIVQDNTQKEEEAPMQQQGSQLTGNEILGNKRAHGSQGPKSDKDSPTTITENHLSIVTATPNTGGWRKVEKKKGRKQ